MLYLLNERCAALADCALESAHPRRSALGHALVAACRPAVSWLRYAPAPLHALRAYHSASYLSALGGGASEEALDAAGLSHDCPAFTGALEYARLVAGGSLAAADALVGGSCEVAVHWDGGRHHARRASASGFCYVQDCVLAIQRLRRGGLHRVLYVDVDVHHCDAVSEAFYATDQVLVVSLHKRGPGFFPGSGDAGETGCGAGRGHTMNLPLSDGLRDALFTELLARLLDGCARVFRPQAVVMCCGCDGLAGDPLGGWSLTPAGLAAAARKAASLGAPMLLLGGGGYCPANCARAWATITASLAGAALHPEAPVPSHQELLCYGPSFCMWDGGAAALRADLNQPNREALLLLVDGLLHQLQSQYESSDQEEEG